MNRVIPAQRMVVQNQTQSCSSSRVQAKDNQHRHTEYQQKEPDRKCNMPAQEEAKISEHQQSQTWKPSTCKNLQTDFIIKYDGLHVITTSSIIAPLAVPSCSALAATN